MNFEKAALESEGVPGRKQTIAEPADTTVEQLWTTVCEGPESEKEQAFENLTKVLLPLAYHVGMSYLHHQDGANEVAQHTMVRLFEWIGRITGGGAAVRSWVYSTASRKSLSLLRVAARAETALEPDPALPELREESTPFHYAELSEMLRRLDKMEGDLLVVMLLRFKGESTQAIASSLNLTPQAVHARLQRARKALGRPSKKNGKRRI